MAPRQEYRMFLDFSGGINDTYSDVKLRDNEGSIFRNVNLDRDGAVSKRKGSVLLTPAQIGVGHEGGGIIQWEPAGGGAPELIVVAGDKVVKYNAGAWDVLYTGLTNNLIALLVPFKNLLFIGNGIDEMLVYAPAVVGTPLVFRPGQPAPASPPTFNANIAGAMTPGDIKVRVRYVSPIDDSFVGEPDTENGTTFTVTGSGGIRINIPVPGAHVPGSYRTAKRLIERTKTGGGIFYIDGYVNDATTTTYDLIISDIELEGNAIAPDLGSRLPMPKLWPFCLSRNRIVGWNDVNRRVEFSTIDEFGILPESFREEDYHYLDITDGEDEPVACLQYEDHVIFYTGRSVHRMFIDDGGQSAAFRLEGHALGIPGPRAAIELPGMGHLVWTYKGPYIYAGEMLPAGERIEQLVQSLSPVALHDLYIVHRYDRRQVKFVLAGPSSSQNDTGAIYHYNPHSNLDQAEFAPRLSWTSHDGFKAKSGTTARDPGTKRDIEYSVDYDGYVRIEDTGDLESHVVDEQIAGEVVTKWFDMGMPNAVKQFEEAWVILQTGETVGQLSVSWESEFGEGGSGSDLLNPSGAVALFDTAVFDVDVFAGGANKVLHVWLGNNGVTTEARHIRFRFANGNSDEAFTVLGIIIAFKPIRDRNDGL